MLDGYFTLEGNDDPTYPTLDLCFGGRRKFVGGSYVDFGKDLIAARLYLANSMSPYFL